MSDDTLSPAKLSQSRKAVAVMRIAAAGTMCDHAAVLLGVRDGTGYKRHTPVKVANLRSAVEPAVAEVELDPGEYHVVAYACANKSGQRVLSGGTDADLSSDGGRIYATSFASFRLDAGEIVNVGHLFIGASRVGQSQFGRPLRIEVEVKDWPLADLERYKAKRPAAYAAMTTRLMRVELGREGVLDDDKCAKLRQAHAEGKVQSLPAPCLAPAAVAKTGRGT